jgi:hypothetical protein
MMATSQDTSRESSESESESLPFLESGEKRLSPPKVSRDWLPTRKGMLAHIFVLILYVFVSALLLKYMKIREQECWRGGLWCEFTSSV